MKFNKYSIDLVVSKIKEILVGNNHSIYLCGSLATQDFKLGWSDIDIFCVFENSLTDEQALKLLSLKSELISEYTGNKHIRLFEGIFVSRDALLYGTGGKMVYWGSSKERITEYFNIDAFLKLDLIDNALLINSDEDTVDIRPLLTRPSSEEIFRSVTNYYLNIVRFTQKTDASLYSVGWLFDIARCIYTLRYEKLCPKTFAGEWAIKERLISDVTVMEKALEVRKNADTYKNDAVVMRWAAALGDDIQRFADKLKQELSDYREKHGINADIRRQ